MARPVFKPDPALKKQWQEGIREVAKALGKTDPEGVQKLVLLSARRFVKNVIDITPPASGKADKGAQRKGEEAILGDLYKIALPVTGEGLSPRQRKEIFASASDLLAAHAAARSGAGGRVNPRNRKEKLLVKQSDFLQVLRRLQKLVGFLAAGLNAAAAKLGTPVPAWIKRHGTKYGEVEVEAKETGIRVKVVQNVPYTDAINGYPRRWQSALTREVKGLQKQAVEILRKRIRKAGVTKLK